MTNEVVNPSARNFFQAYGDQTSQRNIIGKLLKFTKGDYTAGQENEEVPAGTRFAVDMENGFLVGWVKWVDQRPEEQILGLLSTGYAAPKRRELPDQDEEQWEVDETTGKPRDPWQPTNTVLFKTPGKKRAEEHLYTFTTSSYGGISNLGKLCKAYGTAMRQHPDENPIVEIGVEKYRHSNPQFGTIKNPTFTIVGWEKKSLFAETAPEAEAPAQVEAPRRQRGRR